MNKHSLHRLPGISSCKSLCVVIGELFRGSLGWICAFLLLNTHCDAAVNINKATEAQLENLKGIGPYKAQAIIDYRNKHRGFKSVDEFENVEGIGPKTLEKLRHEIVISDKPAKPSMMLEQTPKQR